MVLRAEGALAAHLASEMSRLPVAMEGLPAAVAALAVAEPLDRGALGNAAAIMLAAPVEPAAVAQTVDRRPRAWMKPVEPMARMVAQDRQEQPAALEQ